MSQLLTQFKLDYGKYFDQLYDYDMISISLKVYVIVQQITQ